MALNKKIERERKELKAKGETAAWVQQPPKPFDPARKPYDTSFVIVPEGGPRRDTYDGNNRSS
jgi:hypothetical protein